VVETVEIYSECVEWDIKEFKCIKCK